MIVPILTYKTKKKSQDFSVLIAEVYICIYPHNNFHSSSHLKNSSLCSLHLPPFEMTSEPSQCRKSRRIGTSACPQNGRGHAPFARRNVLLRRPSGASPRFYPGANGAASHFAQECDSRGKSCPLPAPPTFRGKVQRGGGEEEKDGEEEEKSPRPFGSE